MSTNGSLINTKKVFLKRDESDLLNFTYMPAEAGKHNAQIGTQTLDFEVQKKSVIPYVISGLVIILMV